MSDDGKLAAVVLAGDRGKSHPVFGKNKAFLEIAGVPIVARVISALDKSKSVAEIYVVGPRDRLEEVLSGDGCDIDKPIHIFDQRANLYENGWHTFLETLPAHRRGESEEAIARGPEADSFVLCIAGDMPLLTSAEVDEFVSRCDMESYDYVLGVTLEKNLEHYYPTGDMPGIHLAYLHFREGNIRQNNMHMLRPFKVINRHYVQTLYDVRYQKDFGNMARLAWVLLTREEGGWGTLGYFLLMQLSLTLDRLALGSMRDLARRRTPVESVIGCISRLMKTRFTLAYTSLGGATLDIDSEHDYEVIEQRFSEWMSYQEKTAKNLASSSSPH